MIYEANFIYENLKNRKIDLVYPTQFGWHKYEGKGNTASSVKQNYILHVVLNGEGIYKVKKQTFKLKKNQAFIIKPTEVVYYYPTSEDEKFEYVWVGIDGVDINNVLERIHLSDFDDYVLNLNDTSKLKDYVFSMINIKSDNSYLYQSILYVFLDELEKQIILDQSNSKIKSKFNNKIIDYINANLKTVSVNSLCDYFNLERTSLYKYFKKEFDMSPQEYILKNKLEIARELIVETHVDLMSVCVSSGFSNYPHFCRIFTKTYNHSPKNYRKLMSVKE